MMCNASEPTQGLGEPAGWPGAPALAGGRQAAADMVQGCSRVAGCWFQAADRTVAYSAEAVHGPTIEWRTGGRYRKRHTLGGVHVAL